MSTELGVCAGQAALWWCTRLKSCKQVVGGSSPPASSGFGWCVRELGCQRHLLLTCYRKQVAWGSKVALACRNVASRGRRGLGVVSACVPGTRRLIAHGSHERAGPVRHGGVLEASDRRPSWGLDHLAATLGLFGHAEWFNGPAPPRVREPTTGKDRRADGLAGVAQHGTAAEQKKVRAAVVKKYPSLKKED